ncbi:hypothetical protein DM02DRAFT_657403 [Periconia macrospinosa]|uniref:tRNA(Phe) 7-[(3-amino-3-carboxypropyl)-4-demethylwyosine(37)-N(4)]-methyltransferase n=1 Tax=Periconia macrospinosa TaxID=97972 RepID=A0A2V1DJX2_9PLEO|nr:hypothetical protein DM02DRAFT_657403 [Periconia macrospinosa]
MATSRFQTRKQKILEQLGVPDSDYHDLSPKGSVDEPIRGLIRDINGVAGLITTSSCSGRISVFLEGQRADVSVVVEQPQEKTVAGPGGKGGGGSWLFISHDAVPMSETEGVEGFMEMFKLKTRDSSDRAPAVSARYIHIKFEPMILHILTATLEDSQRVLTAALSAGFRESGAVSLNPSKSGELNPIVAVRSMGYSFDAIIGYQKDTGENVALVDEAHLRTLVAIANERFNINSERIRRFQTSLLEQYAPLSNPNAKTTNLEWEDAETRKQRKREEGLARQRALKEEKDASRTSPKQESEASEIIDPTNELLI